MTATDTKTPTAEEIERFQRIAQGGAGRILRERVRQVATGCTVEHDVEHHEGAELLASAIAYAAIEAQVGLPIAPAEEIAASGPCTWKPSDNPIRNLERAGALIAAEIDRLLALGIGQ